MTINSTLVGGAGCSAGVPAVADTDENIQNRAIFHVFFWFLTPERPLKSHIPPDPQGNPGRYPNHWFGPSLGARYPLGSAKRFLRKI